LHAYKNGLFLFIKFSVSLSSAAVLQEYCDDKSFVPTCSASDEVIIMEQATYGRMRLGKCVPEDYASMLWDVQLTFCHLSSKSVQADTAALV
jgi:hypothetical protein